MNREPLLAAITDFYLKSSEFNGIPLRQLLADGDEKTHAALREAIMTEEISVVFGDGHANPHIRALPDYHSPTKQVELLGSPLAAQACVYPLQKHLLQVVDQARYAGRPFALTLALGEPQLVHRAFDLAVLESYRNDPRYYYDSDDIHGTLSIGGEHYESTELKQSDKIIIQSFGFAYDEDLNKYVAVFLRDLFRLSPEHQGLWHAREESRKTTLHPDYFRTAILGEWPERVSIYQAFIEELQVINKMAAAMDRPALFREDYTREQRPKEFASLLRPTAREFNAFVHLLDKLMSENINRDFFGSEVAFEEEIDRGGNKVEVRPIGTIRILETWLARRFKPKDSEPIKEMFDAFREVRRLRQKPAHAVDANRFDQQFVHAQREIIERAYGAIRTLRQILANHPDAKNVEISEWLWEGKIWTR